MSGDFDNSHPARKVDPNELMEVLIERNQKVPAVTRRVIAEKFPEVDPDTVSNNLNRLVKADKLRSFSDGDTKVYWYPRTDEDGGAVEYSELFDNSISWDEVDVDRIPVEIAEEIASERLPYYRSQSFWTRTTNISQMGVMISFGLVILGIGGLVSGTLGIGQNLSGQLFTAGLRLSLIALIGYVISSLLDILSEQGYVPKDPRAVLEK